MLRDCHQYHYTRGPGYRGPDDEQYWVRGERRATARLPYRIWVVAAYCSPVVSVGRSIRRAVLHQRGVSLDELLRSHKVCCVVLLLLALTTQTRPRCLQRTLHRMLSWWTL